MKKEKNIIGIAILIIAALVLFEFTSCEKNEVVMPEKQELTIEASAYSVIAENIDFNVTLSYGEYESIENKSFVLKNQVNQVIYKKVIYIGKDEVINLKIDAKGLVASAISITAYTNPGKSTTKLYSDNMTISLVDNAFKNVVIE